MRVRQLLPIVVATLPLGCTFDFSSVGPSGRSTGAAGGPPGTGGDGAAGAGASSQDGGSTSATGVTGCVASGGHCVPDPPAGWTGPVIRTDTGACPPPSIVLASGGLAFDAGDQPACACSPQMASCYPATVKFFSGPSCGPGGSVEQYMVQETVCQTANPTFSVGALTVTIPPQPNLENTCEAPSPAPVYGEPADLCSIAGGDDCDSGQACAPGTGSSCIYQAGDVVCPEGYDVAPAFVIGVNQCSCAMPGPVNCTGRLDIWDAATCNGPPEVELDLGPVTPACVEVSLASSFRTQFLPTQTAACAQVPAQPASTTYTVCCADF